MIEYVFIDMDNTIAENTTCDDIPFHRGLYLNKRPIQIVINAIKYLYPNQKYIIISQVTDPSGVDEKHKWLDLFFSETFDRLIIPYTVSKDEVIKTYALYHNIKLKNILLIDDKKSILQNCKQLGINVKYPQQIICDYEERGRSYDIYSLHSF